MSSKYFGLWRRSAALLITAALAAAGAHASGPQLATQGDAFTLDGSAPLGRGWIRWSRGAFLQVDTGAGAPHYFYAFNREGKMISSANTQVPDLGPAQSIDSDRGTDGAIVFAARYGPLGAAIPLLVFVSPDGQISRVVHTAPYWPYRLSIAPDGTVWTIGYEWVHGDPQAAGLDPDAGVLRHFDATGKLIGSALPQSEFKAAHQLGGLTDGFLIAKRDRLAWYSPQQTPGKYVEIPLDTMKPHVYPGLPEASPPRLVRGFALTDSGNAFLSLQDATSPDPSQRLRTYVFDRAASKWVPIEVPAIGGHRNVLLIGSDGDDLVFKGSDYSVQFFSLTP